jgi:hypothetical protein
MGKPEDIAGESSEKKPYSSGKETPRYEADAEPPSRRVGVRS